MNPFSSLRGRLAIGAAAVALVSVAAAGISIVWQLDRQDRAGIDQELQKRVAHITAGEKMSAAAQAAALDGRVDKYSMLLDGSGSVVRLIEYGSVIAERGDEAGAGMTIPAGEGLSDVSADGQTWRSLVVQADAETTLQVAESMAPLDERLTRNVQIVALVTLAVTIMAAIVGWSVAAGIMRPLDRLRVAAQGVRSDLDAHDLPPSHGPREVDELTGTLNAMIGRLRNSTAVARRFTADAGHELRTPLTSMGAYIETLQRDPEPAAPRRQTILAELAAEHGRLVSLLAGLQQLARVDAAVLPAREPVDVGEQLEAATRRARSRHPETTIELIYDRDATVVVDGWPEGIQVMIGNLLENAALHGRPHGMVQLESRVDGATVLITVADDGPGIEPAERERVWERFARGADPRGPGSGLGLALVAHQVVLHGGVVRLADSPSLGGLMVEIRLPRASERPAT